MAGTVLPVNHALSRPLLIAGCEKRLAILNGLLAFLLVAATYLHFPQCLIGIGVYVLLHGVCVIVAKCDPHFGSVFQRATRYLWQSTFLAKSHVSVKTQWVISSVPH